MDPVSQSTSSTVPEALVCEEQPPVSGAAPPPPPRPASTSTTEAHDDPSAEDSRLERAVREKLEQLGPEESLELSEVLGAKAKLAAEFRGKIRAEKRQDGTFVVEVEGQGTVGVGAPGTGAARVGVAAGTRFHVKNAAEAADLADALLKGATVVAVPAGSLIAAGFRAAGVKDDLLDAPDRVLRYVGSVSQVKVDLVAHVQLGEESKEEVKFDKVTLKPLSARATAQWRESLVVDFEKGELRQDLSFGLGGDAALKIPIFLNVSEAVKATAVVSTVRKMPDELKQALKEGRITPADAWKKLALRGADAVIGRIEGEMSGRLYVGAGGELKVRVRAEKQLDLNILGEGMDLDALSRAMSDLKWSVESEPAIGAGTGFDIGVAKAEIAIVQRYRHKIEFPTAEEAIAEAKRQLEDTDQVTQLRARAAITP